MPIKLAKRGRPRGSRNATKKLPILYNEVVEWRQSGLTYGAIANKLGISKQRVQQIYSHSPEYIAERKIRTARPVKSPKTWLALADAIANLETPEPVIVPTDLLRNAPAVYTLVDESGIVLYVGQCRSGIARALTPPYFSDKSRREAFSRVKEVRIYWCESIAQMNALEVKLMIEHSPEFNRQLSRFKHVNGISLKS